MTAPMVDEDWYLSEWRMADDEWTEIWQDYPEWIDDRRSFEDRVRRKPYQGELNVHDPILLQFQGMLFYGRAVDD